jgi:hypothetical protein
MTLELRINPTAGEEQSGCQALAAATLPPSRAGWITAGIYFVVGLAAVLLTPSTAAATVLLAVGGLVAAMTALQIEGRWRMRSALAADPHVDEHYTVEVGEAGLRTYCDHVDTSITWSGITRVVETPEFFIFVRGASGGAVVPKRVVTPADDQVIRSMIRNWSPDQGRHLTEPSRG